MSRFRVPPQGRSTPTQVATVPIGYYAPIMPVPMRQFVPARMSSPSQLQLPCRSQDRYGCQRRWCTIQPRMLQLSRRRLRRRAACLQSSGASSSHLVPSPRQKQSQQRLRTIAPRMCCRSCTVGRCSRFSNVDDQVGWNNAQMIRTLWSLYRRALAHAGHPVSERQSPWAAGDAAVASHPHHSSAAVWQQTGCQGCRLWGFDRGD